MVKSLKQYAKNFSRRAPNQEICDYIDECLDQPLSKGTTIRINLGNDLSELRLRWLVTHFRKAAWNARLDWRTIVFQIE